MRRRSAAVLALALLLPLPGLAGEVVVKPGETLSEIAERYGTSVQRLMQLNNLRSPQDLWAGSRIQVPGAGGGGGAASSGARTTTVKANYTVKPGETLSELAERYGTTVEQLMQLNGLRSAQDLWAGSRIQVPVTRRVAAAKPAPAVNRNASQHKVQPGETLSVIAQRYGVSTQNLVALNNLSDPNQVVVGQTLQLRGTPKPKPKPAAKPQPVAAKPAAKPVAQPAPKPVAAKPTPKPAEQPAATPVAAKPEPQPEPKPEPKPQPVAAKPEPKPEPKPAAKPASKPATVATASAAKPGKASAPDWRSYGPLQVDWANWQPMGGSYVAPSLNSDGQPLYLAINCSAKRLNATGQSGTWKTWDAPQSDFEHKLINDLCTAKGG